MKRYAREFLEQLPPLNYTVFVYMVTFFREVLAQKEYNRTTAARMASICLECMASFPYVESASGTGSGSVGTSGGSGSGSVSVAAQDALAAIDKSKMDLNALLVYFLTASSI